MPDEVPDTLPGQRPQWLLHLGALSVLGGRRPLCYGATIPAAPAGSGHGQRGCSTRLGGMAQIADPYSPPFTTETDEKPPWTDCTWASGLMFANKGDRGGHPNTRAERELLRKAAADNYGGSTLQDLSRGLLRRYGWGLYALRVSEGGLLSRLKRGDGAVVQGNYHLLTPHFQRWDVRFAARTRGLHAAYVQGHDRGGNWHIGPNGVLRDVFWCDPLGRSPAGTPADKRYRGEWMPVPVLLRFLSGLGDQAHRYATTVQDGEHS